MSVAPIALDSIDTSPLNPRKTFDQAELDELVDDVRVRGVLQNIVVRPKAKKRFEIVVGERRYRAAKAAGLTEIPASVVELDDQAALETMLVENAQRADVTPLEEADAYGTLVDQHGLSIAQIAAKVSKSPATVAKRLVLRQLTPANRKALEAGELLTEVAVMLARIPDPKEQDKAGDALSPRWLDGLATVAIARDVLSDFTRRLATAPWALDDAALVKKAGACAACPKRTGNKVAMFGDAEKDDTCLDAGCFAAKRKAWGAVRAAELEKAGAKRLGKKASKEAVRFVHHSGRFESNYSSDFELLDDECHDDPKRRTYRKLLDPAPDEIVVAQLDQGAVELIPRKGLAARLKKAGHKFGPKSGRGTSSAKSEAQRERDQKANARHAAKMAIKKEVERRILEAAYQAASAPGKILAEVDVYRHLALGFLSREWAHGEALLAIVGAPKATQGKVVQALLDWIEDEARTASEIYGLLMTRAGIEGFRGEGLERLGALYELDRKVIDRQVRADAKALKKATAKPAKKKAPKKKAAKKSSRKKARR